MLGNVATQLRGILVAAHCSDIEPFVRLHQIDWYARARRKNHAHTETIFSVDRLDAPRGNLHACHFGSPFLDHCAPCSRSITHIPVVRISSSEQRDLGGENLNDSLNDAMNRK